MWLQRSNDRFGYFIRCYVHSYLISLHKRRQKDSSKGKNHDHRLKTKERKDRVRTIRKPLLPHVWLLDLSLDPFGRDGRRRRTVHVLYRTYQKKGSLNELGTKKSNVRRLILKVRSNRSFPVRMLDAQTDVRSAPQHHVIQMFLLQTDLSLILLSIV